MINSTGCIPKDKPLLLAESEQEPRNLLMKVREESEKAGLTQRDGMGKEEGGGFRMGSTCIPVMDSF